MTLETKEYNRFFYASVCHICKQSCRNVVVHVCPGCRMIAYCSKEHRQEHWPAHQDLCNAIQYVRETFMGELSAHAGTPNFMNLLLTKVTHKIQRNLQYYETQMFLCPRMCQVCYKINNAVRCCRCMTVWLCPLHMTSKHDRNTCDLLNLCFESDISLFQETALPYLTDVYIQRTSYEEEFPNMKEFINIYGGIKGIQSETSPHLLEIKQSIRLTRILTIVCGMCIVDIIPLYKKNKTELVLHVIAADTGELVTLREWEILLHMFPTLLHLKLVLIGPIFKFIEKWTVCDSCVQNKKSFLIEWENISYKQYIHSCRTFKKPDLVIKFHNDRSNAVLTNIWKSSVKYIAKLKCPLLLSHPCENNTSQEIINIELGKTIEFRTYKNPFASLKPQTEYDKCLKYSIFYENNFLTAYKSL